jgi:tRNA 2-thiouridine synthesizing protein A
MTETTPVQQLDCRNDSCPILLTQAEEALKNLKSGQILEILGTAPEAKTELADFASKRGFHFLNFEDTNEFTRYFIKK